MKRRNAWIGLAGVGCCFLAGTLLHAAPAARDPSAVFSNPRFQRATELMGAGRHAQAEAVLEAAVKAGPEPDGYGLLGYAREMQNRFAAAEKAYRESLRLDTDFLFARIRLGIVLTKQKRNRESIEVLRPIETALSRHPEALFHLCLAYLETGDPAGAAAAAEKMEAFGPEMALRAAKLFVWKEKFPESLPLLSRPGRGQSRVCRGQLPAGKRPVSDRPDRTDVALPGEGSPAKPRLAAHPAALWQRAAGRGQVQPGQGAPAAGSEAAAAGSPSPLSAGQDPDWRGATMRGPLPSWRLW